MAKFPVMVANPSAISGALSTMVMSQSPLNGGWTVNAGFRDIPFSVATDVSDFYMAIGTAPGGSATRTMRLRKNASNDNLVAVFNSGDTSAQDTTNTNSYSAGDRIDLSCTIASSPASTSDNRWAYQTSATNQTLQSSSASTVSTSVTAYVGIQDNAGSGTSANTAIQTVVGSGTFRNLYCGMGGIVTSGSYLVEVYKNGSPTGVKVTLDSSNQYAADTSNSVSYSEGDEFYYQVTPSSPSNARGICMSLENVADVAGTGMLLGSSGGNLTNTTVFNTWYCANATTFNATESTRQALALEHRATRMFVKLSAAPGSGQTRTVTHRLNGSDTSLAVAISGTNTSGGTSFDVDVADFDLVGVKASTSGGAANSRVRYAILYKVVEASTFVPKVLMF